MYYEELVKRLREHNGWALNETLDEAADAIEELEKYIPRWVSVTERLPREKETVLTWGKQGVILFDWLYDSKWCCFGKATHWMPMPEPPKEE